MKRHLRKVIPIKNPRNWKRVKIPLDQTHSRTMSPLLMDLLVENISDPDEMKFSDLLSLWHEGEIGYDYSQDLTEDKISKITWEFAKMFLSREDKSELRHRLEYARYGNELTEDILKHKYPKPEYPKYKKSAKELFEF